MGGGGGTGTAWGPPPPSEAMGFSDGGGWKGEKGGSLMGGWGKSEPRGDPRPILNPWGSPMGGGGNGMGEMGAVWGPQPHFEAMGVSNGGGGGEKKCRVGPPPPF